MALKEGYHIRAKEITVSHFVFQLQLIQSFQGLFQNLCCQRKEIALGGKKEQEKYSDNVTFQRRWRDPQHHFMSAKSLPIQPACER